jgi:hypothetical protein
MAFWFFFIHSLMIVGVTRMKDPEGLENYYTVNLHAPMQVINDWDKEWITDIKVIEKSDNCTDLVNTEDTWMHLFGDPWEYTT